MALPTISERSLLTVAFLLFMTTMNVYADQQKSTVPKHTLSQLSRVKDASQAWSFFSEHLIAMEVTDASIEYRCKVLLFSTGRLANFKDILSEKEFQDLEIRLVRSFFETISIYESAQSDLTKLNTELYTFDIEDSTPFRSIRNKDYSDPAYLEIQELRSRATKLDLDISRSKLCIDLLFDGFIKSIKAVDRDFSFDLPKQYEQFRISEESKAKIQKSLE